MTRKRADGGQPAREERLRAALRENLKRRKEQARRREQGSAAPASEDQPSPKPRGRPGDA
jgi:hypothetical protein